MKPFTWSYSAYEDYQTCPKKYYETRILKRYVQEMGEAQLGGLAGHKALELRVKDKIPLEGGLVRLEPLMTKILSSPGEIYTEQKLAVDKNYQPVDFFASNVWCRGIIDLNIIYRTKAAPLDYKFGKRKVGSGQLKLMSLLTFANFSEVQKTYTGFVWLKEELPKVDAEVFKREDTKDLWKSFEGVVADMQFSYENQTYPPKKNGLCREWCPVVECKYNGKFNGRLA